MAQRAYKADVAAAWASAVKCANVITPYAPVGWTAGRLASIETELASHGIRLHRIRRFWDSENWPHAHGGFFAFRAAVKSRAIPHGERSRSPPGWKSISPALPPTG
jgi:hypothetical protein